MNCTLSITSLFFSYSIGAESLAVAQNNYAVLWFKGKELNMVFGLQLSFARVGSTVNFMVMGHIYDWLKQTYPEGKCIGLALVLGMYNFLKNRYKFLMQFFYSYRDLCNVVPMFSNSGCV